MEELEDEWATELQSSKLVGLCLSQLVGLGRRYCWGAQDRLWHWLPGFGSGPGCQPSCFLACPLKRQRRPARLRLSSGCPAADEQGSANGKTRSLSQDPPAKHKAGRRSFHAGGCLCAIGARLGWRETSPGPSANQPLEPKLQLRDARSLVGAGC